jgi:hypothetical protein
MKVSNSVRQTITHEISRVTFPVAHFLDFDVTTHDNVTFRVFREGDWFKAIPQISLEERKTTGIPQELVFVYWNHVVLGANNTEEETLNVIKNIILELEVQDLV